MGNKKILETNDRVTIYALELERIFKTHKDPYRSHEMSRKVLQEMSEDPAFLPHLIRKHLANPENYNRPHFPLPGMTLAETPYFTCYAHFWFGNMPQREQGRSVTCVHHHGALLLTTIALYGPGCEVWLFSRPRETAEGGIFNMEHIVQHQNSVRSFTFVDTGQPHLIFPPESLSITVALWSRHTRAPFLNALKTHPLIRENKQTFLKISHLFRLSDTLQINEVINFDFVPLELGFQAVPQRLQYPYASNEDYLVNLFHIVEETENQDQVSVILELLEKKEDAFKSRSLIQSLARRLEKGDKIPARVSECHRFVQGLNVTKAEVRRALGVEIAEARSETEVPK